MRTLKLISIFLVATFFSVNFVDAQTTEERVEAAIKLANSMKNETKSPAAPVDFISALLAQEALSEEETKARADFTTSLFAYYAFAENHKIDVFEWQMFSSKVIFVVVLMIVGLGIYFSWMQFHAHKDLTKLKEQSMEIGKTGLKVTTNILGVIILVLSLAFLYLYLVYVYPITFV
ncbi:hypothetical protein RB2150_00929 [Rhodobacterales bacterium HTCC2150]|nr:hypothetical protein RB2150_00929 [Rhodobacterales bacterium HTCC2150] [Rhodobacteraceae bacterium HTCC2150]